MKNVPAQQDAGQKSPWRDSCRLTYTDKKLMKQGVEHKKHHSNSSSPSSDRGSINYARNKTVKLNEKGNIR